MSEHVAGSGRYLGAILDCLEDAVLVVTGPENRVEFVNKAFDAVFGAESGRILDNSIETIFSDKTDYGRFLESLKGKAGERGLYDFVRKDNRRITAEIRSYPLELDGEKAERRAVVISDVTAARNAEAEKEKKQIQSLQMYKMEAVGRFTAGIAHDFNNLLTGIQGFSRLAMKRVGEGEPLRNDLEQIYSAAERTGVLTRQLLFFSRKQPVKSRYFTVNGTVKNMSTIMKWLVGENIKIVTDLAAGLWPVFGNEIKIEQVIINMLLNARDAMPSGGTVIIKTENADVGKSYVESFPEAKYGKYVCLSIQDSGTGMSKETLEHIFEPFFTTKEAKRGLGLGLFAAYGIVKQHDGWIDYDSTPGRGTVFEVYLPAASLQAGQEKEEAVFLQDYNGKGERILLVEDEEVVREFASQALSMHGYAVFGADSAVEARKIFEREKGDFSLALIDVVLNDVSGIELAESLKAGKPDLNVMLSSGYTDHKSEIKTIAEKGYKLLQKPYSVDELLQSVKEIIIKHG